MMLHDASSAHWQQQAARSSIFANLMQDLARLCSSDLQAAVLTHPPAASHLAMDTCSHLAPTMQRWQHVTWQLVMNTARLTLTPSHADRTALHNSATCIPQMPQSIYADNCSADSRQAHSGGLPSAR